MNKSKETATVKANPARALRAELAHKIASFMGNEEKRITEIFFRDVGRNRQGEHNSYVTTGKDDPACRAGALAALMVPLVASRLVDGWNWSAGSFVFVYVLFFALGMTYALIARKMNAWAYKVGVGLALVTGFAFGWSNLVQVADSEHPENLVYHIVLAVGVVGALLARLKARGLAYTLFAMPGTLTLIAVILPSGAPPDLARNMAIGHGVYVALLITSGLLFRHASLAGLK